MDRRKLCNMMCLLPFYVQPVDVLTCDVLIGPTSGAEMSLDPSNDDRTQYGLSRRRQEPLVIINTSMFDEICVQIQSGRRFVTQ